MPEETKDQAEESIEETEEVEGDKSEETSDDETKEVEEQELNDETKELVEAGKSFKELREEYPDISYSICRFVTENRMCHQGDGPHGTPSVILIMSA